MKEGKTFQEQLLAVRKQLWPGQEKVAILVDGTYLFIEIRRRYGKNVNYAALLRKALGRGQLEKAIVFTFQCSAAERFHNALLCFGYEIQTKPIKILANGKTKCNCDGEIITEMFKLAENGVHTIVLVAGDSDFERPIQYLKDKGKKVRVIGIKGTVAKELKRLVPVLYIDERMLMPQM